jgi:HD-like signal output (HDOD) protein
MHNNAIISEEHLKKIHRYISRMPGLSTTVIKVMELCNNPEVSPNDLSRVISLDPVIAGQVLKLVNSAYYSLAQKTTSLSRAIIILGINTIKNLSLSIAVMTNIRIKESSEALSIDEFLTHSICVAVTAKSLSVIKHIPVLEREEYFVAGLLHDLGKIPISNCFSEDYVLAFQLVKSQQVPFYEAEQNIFGFNHCTVGRIIGKKWSLGQNLQDSMYYHHKPEDVKEENRKFIEIIALADAYSHIMNKEPWGEYLFEDTIIPHLIEHLAINSEELLGLRETIANEIDKAKVFLQITKEN